MNIGTEFNFTYAPGVSFEQMIGFELAGQFWSSHLSDNVSINIFVEISDALPENVIGGALPGFEDNVLYSDFRNALEADITSKVDTLINNNQQLDRNSYTAYFDSQFEDLTGYKVENNQHMEMTRANAKALGLINGDSSELDGYIVTRNLDGSGESGLESLAWNYEYTDSSVGSDRLDFLSVAIHEVGHVLGFVSGVDRDGWLTTTSDFKKSKKEAKYYDKLEGSLNNATPVDMLRYSQESNSMSGAENWIDMSVGGNPYLSFTGSSGEAIAYFSTGVDTELGGDGYQASHWKAMDEAIGIMDPRLKTGQRREITQLDLSLFDAIGWDLKTENTEQPNITTLYLQAQTLLADKMEVSLDWMTANPDESAEILTPEFVDIDGNGYDDRNEQVVEMLIDSGEVYNGGKAYNWGWWNPYGWGWWNPYGQTITFS
ncbi:NF038122 family metalloprotease [Myxosarcina sp. GI1]|uniref:NF038122 family metalloprotease n=1 Tax=Myxosarcina sp. GI1 TaxID=1541065 RepID=UPI00155AA7F8|nr:NF038122 family metalloprotease [Myxosarcina sp. GI1]